MLSGVLGQPDGTLDRPQAVGVKVRALLVRATTDGKLYTPGRVRGHGDRELLEHRVPSTMRTHKIHANQFIHGLGAGEPDQKGTGQ